MFGDFQKSSSVCMSDLQKFIESCMGDGTKIYRLDYVGVVPLIMSYNIKEVYFVSNLKFYGISYLEFQLYRYFIMPPHAF